MKKPKVRLMKANIKKRGLYGPEPVLLKIDGDWEEAVKKSFAKKKPAKGWPKD
jgi:hypothetical protein